MTTIRDLIDAALDVDMCDYIAGGHELREYAVERLKGIQAILANRWAVGAALGVTFPCVIVVAPSREVISIEVT